MIHDSNFSKLMIFRFTGNAWLGLSLNKLSKGPEWHLQAKVNSHSRSDTMRPNRSPVVQMKPFFKYVFKDIISHGILRNIIYIHIKMLCFIWWLEKNLCTTWFKNPNAVKYWALRSNKNLLSIKIANSIKHLTNQSIDQSISFGWYLCFLGLQAGCQQNVRDFAYCYGRG